MYTELVMSTRIKNDPQAVAILKYMADDVTPTSPPPLPDHPLFKTARWDMLFKCSSYYFVPRSMVMFEFDKTGEYWVLISRADIKNYDGEIEKFIDWIGPYIAERDDSMIGYSRYEETREPTIYYAASSSSNGAED